MYQNLSYRMVYQNEDKLKIQLNEYYLELSRVKKQLWYSETNDNYINYIRILDLVDVELLKLNLCRDVLYEIFINIINIMYTDMPFIFDLGDGNNIRMFSINDYDDFEIDFYNVNNTCVSIIIPEEYMDIFLDDYYCLFLQNLPDDQLEYLYYIGAGWNLI